MDSSTPIDLTADNDDIVVVVTNALKAVGVNKLGLAEFEREHLLKLHRGGYKSLMMLENATKDGLASCGLPAALCDFLLSQIARRVNRAGDDRGGSSSTKKPRSGGSTDQRRNPHPTAKVVAATVEDREDPENKAQQKIQKIRKLLETATNDGATESERHNAMFLAKKLMGAIGVTESDIQSSTTTSDLVSGTTIVKIDGTIIWSAWYNNLSNFACTMCSVSASYVTSDMELTFYGVKDRAVMAANTFEIMFNRMPSIVDARPATIHGKADINSYRIGIISGLTERLKIVTQNRDNDREIREIIFLDDAAKKVAEKMSLTMNLKNARRSTHKFVSSAFNRGREDSRKIEIHQGSLDAGP